MPQCMWTRSFQKPTGIWIGFRTFSANECKNECLLTIVHKAKKTDIWDFPSLYPRSGFMCRSCLCPDFVWETPCCEYIMVNQSIFFEITNQNIFWHGWARSSLHCTTWALDSACSLYYACRRGKVHSPRQSHQSPDSVWICWMRKLNWTVVQTCMRRMVPWFL